MGTCTVLYITLHESTVLYSGHCTVLTELSSLRLFLYFFVTMKQAQLLFIFVRYSTVYISVIYCIVQFNTVMHSSHSTVYGVMHCIVLFVQQCTQYIKRLCALYITLYNTVYY